MSKYLRPPFNEPAGTHAAPLFTLQGREDCNITSPQSHNNDVCCPNLSSRELLRVRKSGPFIRGIAATAEDVASRETVFSAGPNARPLELNIPRYAIYEDKETGEHSHHVISRAEEASGFGLLGAFRAADGTQLAGSETDFQLLGQFPP